MVKALQVMVLLYVPGCLMAQVRTTNKNAKNRFTDSASAMIVKDDQLYDLPIITLNETERSESSSMYIPALLHANRDVLVNTAGFHFSVTRFRLRGYGTDQFGTLINGMRMNNPDDGNTQWGLWSGLNEIGRNAQTILGLRSTEYGFGNTGNTTVIDMRASKQRVQTQYGYSFSNRSFTHKWMYGKTVAMNRKGWAFSYMGSFRSATESYFPGTDYSSGSYFLAIDKRIGEEHLLSFLFFGSSIVNGRQAAVLKESVALAGESFYNPNWGYQSGKKRNANTTRSHQPVWIVTDERRINNHTTVTATMGIVAGEKSSTALDWYHASDPRPDYYRYLPSYQTDSLLRITVADAVRNEEYLRQINWNRLYEINRNNIETLRDANGIIGNDYRGKRSHYIQEERVIKLTRIDAGIVFNTRWNEVFSFTGGASALLQQSRYCKRIGDLLGGEYYVDRNQFAENNTGTDVMQVQNDLNRPNRVLQKGDVYGYDYGITTTITKGFAQLQATRRKTELFAAVEISSTTYFRDGKMKNGLFPKHSFGRSAADFFTNYKVKAGITYKINGRKYGYLHGALMNKAPLFDNVYISPRTRDSKQDTIRNEVIATVEAGWVWNSPTVKMRLSGYLTSFKDGMNVMTFYHDGYRSFVNYALRNINKIHFGTELGAELKLNAHLNMLLAASVGRYYYNSRQQVSVSADDDAYVLEKSMVYSKDFRVEGTPQEAYSLGFNYQSSGSFYMNLTANYFRQQWLAWNPVRRTYAVMENITEGSALWHAVIDQTQLPDQYTVDLSGGTSLSTRLFGSGQRQTIVFNISINNLLNKKDLISGGFEQLRFDTDTKNTEKFPPKYYFAMGLNFSASISLRL
ncbi:MAG: TonB-dependent receptor [Bacteroidota bacterium]